MRKIIGISGALLSIGLLFGGCKPAVQQAQDTAISFCKDPEIKTRLMNIIEKQHAETLGSVGLGSAPIIPGKFGDLYNFRMLQENKDSIDCMAEINFAPRDSWYARPQVGFIKYTLTLENGKITIGTYGAVMNEAPLTSDEIRAQEKKEGKIFDTQ